MNAIIYSGEMERIHQLPYHITDRNETIVFEKDIIHLVCENQEAFYSEHFLGSPNYFMSETTIDGERAFSLLAFINECINIFDYYVQAEIEGLRETTASLHYMSNRVFPVVSAVAKIGAKIQSGEMEEGETPASIFEREIRRTDN